jgi:LacI family transcriptional regulator
VRDCGFTENDGYAAMKNWIAEGTPPTAVFAANDPAAIGAMAALHESGIRVPEDISIVGAGNIHYGDMLRVPLTTVAWSTAEMGQAAARLLLEAIDEKTTLKNQQVVVSRSWWCENLVVKFSKRLDLADIIFGLEPFEASSFNYRSTAH